MTTEMSAEMRPSRMKSTWVKILPWYYTDRKDPGRQNVEAKALTTELCEGEERRNGKETRQADHQEHGRNTQ